MDESTIIADVISEFNRAQELYGPFHSMHEGESVIREEMAELSREVWKNDLERSCNEAIQLAAMCVRYVYDLKRSANPRNRSWKFVAAEQE